ncbi:SapC family protein [Limnohabitans sp. T6-5]|uniref:SapC family protein n=1 Tax=Limnohabitans sp. T6-5 TaxID=1100724 RepID=UPI001305038F|nr:SapC family protein [Limnohabitans sp. T6-5]
MTNGVFPILYKNPQALNPEQHGQLSLHPEIGFGFARETNSLPLVIEEFSVACRDYVIVFTTGDTAMPLAVLGMNPDHNAYVQADGHWAANTYIPAYVRRYPFIFAENEGSNDLTLCVDFDSKWVVPGQTLAFFDEQGIKTTVTDQALEFCKRFHIQMQQTREFSEALQAADILVDQHANITLENGETLSLSGFRIIDEHKLRQLPAKTLQKFVASGWMGLIYAHLISMGSMNKLANLLKANPKMA